MHPDTFEGAGRKFRKIPWAKLARDKHNAVSRIILSLLAHRMFAGAQPRSEEQSAKRVERLLARVSLNLQLVYSR